jgi:8-oxo-dGTP pyrophosphatase MutT (NUDIX family)
LGFVEEIRELIGHRRINLCASVVIIENAQGQILMQQRTYPYGRWGLPGGIMELGESAEETARREVFEETGLVIGALKLLGVYSGRDYLCVAENGDEWYTVITAYVTAEYTGHLSVHDEESISLAWRGVDDLPENIAGTHRVLIEDYLKTRMI